MKHIPAHHPSVRTAAAASSIVLMQPRSSHPAPSITCPKASRSRLTSIHLCASWKASSELTVDCSLHSIPSLLSELQQLLWSSSDSFNHNCSCHPSNMLPFVVQRRVITGQGAELHCSLTCAFIRHTCPSLQASARVETNVFGGVDQLHVRCERKV